MRIGLPGQHVERDVGAIAPVEVDQTIEGTLVLEETLADQIASATSNDKS